MKPRKKSPKKTVRKAAATASSPPPRPAAKPKRRRAPQAAKASVKSSPPPAATPAKTGVSAKGFRLKIPPILLEQEVSPAAAPGGPGQRYALGPAAPKERFPGAEPPGELPEAYGTQRLLLTARDPHWLYAAWDLTREQLRRYADLSSQGHLALRCYINEAAGQPLVEIQVQPESRHWFFQVGQGGTRYVAELGYPDRQGDWNRISISKPAMTPPDTLAEDTSVQFATLPPEITIEKLLDVVQIAVSENVPLVEAVQQLRATGHPELPATPPPPPAPWTPAQARALAQIVTMDHQRRVWIGSLEVTELVRRQYEQEISSAGAAQISRPPPAAEAVSSVSSPMDGPEQPKSFWLKVNAELVIYGATVQGAKVTIGSRPVKPNSDGTFSHRFALPDGQYDLPVVAITADGTDGRSADLKFSRSTEYRGAVVTLSPDPGLQAPYPADGTYV
ncbi:MAG: DUF4912 domain-containing protein [Chloroflexi bacterium]|nr:DUF4912 domain-containing protein [Chloroflexota bacterium]